MTSTAIRLHFRVPLMRLESLKWNHGSDRFLTNTFYGRGRVLYCRARNGERRKSERKIGGNAFPSRLPTPHPLCFSCSLFIAPSPLSERLEMAMRPFHSHKFVFLCVCAQYAIRWIVRSFVARYDWQGNFRTTVLHLFIGVHNSHRGGCF